MKIRIKSHACIWTSNEIEGSMIKSLLPLYQAILKKISLIFSGCGIYFKVFFSLQLFLFNFYPFLQRYLQPHQKGWQLLTFNLCGMWPLTVLTVTLHFSVYVILLFVLCSIFPCSPFSPLGFPFSLSSFLCFKPLSPHFLFAPSVPFHSPLLHMYHFDKRLHYLVNYSL